MQKNASHWDVMKFDINGTCLYNNIYGQYNFGNTPTMSWGTLTGLTEMQVSYLSNGVAYDFVQKMSGTTKYDSRITIVGQQQMATTAGPIYKAAIVQIEDNGNVVSKRFLDTPSTSFESVARAITLVEGPNPYFVIAITKQTTNNVIVELYALEYGFGPASSPVWLYDFGTAYNVNDNKAGATVWSLHYKNGFLYVPVIERCNNVLWAGDNQGELFVYKISVPGSMPLSSPVPSVLSKKIANVHAFDLKARMTELSNGNFAIVSTVQKTPWAFGSIPAHILGPVSGAPLPCGTVPGMNCQPTTIGYWNTDAYVAEISASNLGIIWSTTFNSENAPPSAANSWDFRDVNNGGGDPKHQECVYAISEGPNGSIIVSGNSSGNVDDNYMVKLVKCSIVPDNH
jgi:hypothetical protein